MQNLKLQDFRKLLFETGKPCVSIYLDGVSSVDRSSAERLATLVDKAAALLATRCSPADAEALLRPAKSLLETNVERLLGRVGLGVFLSPATQAFVCLPRAPRERLVVADSFHLKPLMNALATTAESFAVLVLTLRGAHYFESDGVASRLVREIPLDRRARAFAAPDRELGGEGRAALRPYFRRVDRAVRALIGRVRRPLILAGPAYLRALYREINTYPYVLHDGFAVDTAVRADTVHARGARVLSSTIERSITQDLSELGRAEDDPNVTFDLKTASTWVALGVVDKIFVAEDAMLTGDQGSDCVLDDLAEEVLRKGGRVVCVPRAGFPRHQLVAAIKDAGAPMRRAPVSQRGAP